MFWALAVIFVLLCASDGVGIGVRVVYAVLAGLAFGAGERLRKSTSQGLRLTRDALETANGEVLFTMDNVDHIDSGIFAFKPPTGFTVVTRTSGRFAWHPGLWWRVGRRVGVGGVTPRGPGKFMAELLKQELQRR